MQAYQENISAKVSGVLSPILGVSVTVTDTATGLPATLYSDNGVTQIAQPLVTDETGYFSFYAANGSYTVKFSSPQIAVGTRKIELYDRDDDAPLTQAQAASPAGASGIGYGQRTVANKLGDIVSVKDAPFNAKGDGTTDDSAAFTAAIAAGKPVFIPPGSYLIAATVQTDLNDVVLIGAGRGVSKILSTVPAGYTFVLGTTAVLAKGGLRVHGIGFSRVSGTTNCLKICENLGAVVADNSFAGFTDYFLEVQRSDGTIIARNIAINGSIKAYSEMDRLIIAENDIQAATNHPAIEVYGGTAQVIEKNFINWGRQEAIVIGFDSARSDYSQSLVIRNNYIERNCQADNGDANRPYVYIGKPVDQTGTAYAGTEIVRWVEFSGNYLNGDVANPNLANVIPVLFERVIEVKWDAIRSINFSNGSASANYPRVKYPAKAIHLGNNNTKYVDLSTSGQGAGLQVTYGAQSSYRTVEFYLGTVSVTTDAAGAGTYNFSNIGTGVNGLDTGRLYVMATPEADCRVFINNKTIAANAASDGSDRSGWRINVVAGPVSSTVNVTVRALALAQ